MSNLDGKAPHKQLLRRLHAYRPEDFSSTEHAVAFDRFRTIVENEIRSWAQDSELRKTFLEALAAAWLEYNDEEPADMEELKQFVDKYLVGVSTAQIWRLAFAGGLGGRLAGRRRRTHYQ